MYRLLNQLCDLVNERRRLSIMTPYSRSIGNCAEEIYYALLKARRDGKHVLLLAPRPIFWKLRVEVANRALFEIESPYATRNDGVLARAGATLLTLLFFCLKQAYLRPRAALERLRRRRSSRAERPRNNIFYVIPSIGRATLWQPGGATRFHWDVVDSRRWDDQYQRGISAHLPRERVAEGDAIRVAMGLPLEAWYVCVHVREGGYHGDWERGAHRNSSIGNYLEAFRAITNAGGFVVRLGDPSMVPLQPTTGIIDYAHSRHKSELMDVYLVAGCRFFVGMNSGPLDLAWLFEKPVVLTNLSEWTRTYPKRPGDLAILKHYYSRSRGRVLSVRELLGEPFESQLVREIGDDYLLIENRPSEIRDVVVEYLSAPAGRSPSPVQRAFNHGRRLQIRKWLEDPALSFSRHPLDDAVEKYRLAAHADASRGFLGRRYLEQHWMDANLERSAS